MICSDGLFCTVGDACNGVGICIGGTNRNCSAGNIDEIATCDYNPDDNIFTWDFRNAFVSTCDEGADSCTTGDSTISHTENDNDEDGYASSCGDCKDDNNLVYPGAAETCNNVDDDCDGSVDEELTQSAEDFGACSGNTQTCSAGEWIDNNEVTPTEENCNNIDDDCNGFIDDGYVNTPTICGIGECTTEGELTCVLGFEVDSCTAGTPEIEICDGSLDEDCDGDVDNGCVCVNGETQECTGSNTGECNAGTETCVDGQWNGACEGEVTPVGEICDGLDNNCDGNVDESTAADTSTWYADADGDNYGNADVNQQACNQPEGYVANSVDCNDDDSAIKLGATEVCDRVDNNCDGNVDEGLTTTFYQDFDGDGFGNIDLFSDPICSAPVGYVEDNTDCDDIVDSVYLGADETCNNIDDNCDGNVDEDLTQSAESLGACSGNTQTCSAGEWINNNEVAPTDETCNNIDDDCDGEIDEDVTITFYQDFDADGYGNQEVFSDPVCSAPEGYVEDNTDCDDTNVEVNGPDTFYADEDNDGLGNPDSSVEECSQGEGYLPEGYVTDNTDTIIGTSADIEGDVIFEVEGEEDPRTIADGVKNVTLKDGTTEEVLVEFSFNFSADNVLDLNDISITVDSNEAEGSIIIKGISLPEGVTKTAYINKLSGSNTICIIDAEVDTITVTDDCSNGVKVTCDGTNGGYTCTTVGDKYKIEGLTNSAITQFSYTAPTSSSSSSSSSSGGGGSSIKKQCDDKKDNDGDGLVDMKDSGCSSKSDNDEKNDNSNNAHQP